MKKIFLNGFACLTILAALLSISPSLPVQAYTEITDTQVWTTPQAITTDIVVTGSGNLTIQTTLTMGCSDSIAIRIRRQSQ